MIEQYTFLQLVHLELLLKLSLVLQLVSLSIQVRFQSWDT